MNNNREENYVFESFKLIKNLVFFPVSFLESYIVCPMLQTYNRDMKNVDKKTFLEIGEGEVQFIGLSKQITS